ncbi:hypothetical protein FGK60_09665 [Streptomyces sp. DASNCL29]|nr:hypothetical protein FGK60_09665 [Streptomyces sp. DASNCL29]
MQTAVLEHDLLGISPEPGSPAALTIALRQVGTCFEHDPVDTGTMADARPAGQCARCGRLMIQDDEGCWQVALQP